MYDEALPGRKKQRSGPAPQGQAPTVVRPPNKVLLEDTEAPKTPQEFPQDALL